MLKLAKMFPPFGFYQDGAAIEPWMEFKDMPLSNRNLAWSSAVQIGDEMYFLTTYSITTNNNTNYYPYFYRLNLKSRSEVSLANYPNNATGGASLALVNGQIYGIGGTNTPTRCYRYDMETNKWEMIADCPTDARNASVGVIDGQIYVAGGAQMPYTQFRRYNPETNIWTVLTDCPFSSIGSSAVVIDDELYVMGGSGAPAYYKLRKYHPQTDTWTELADIPLITNSSASVVIQGQIYVISSSKNFLRYDPEKNIWEILESLPVVSSGIPAAVHYNDAIYVIGGLNPGKIFTYALVNEQTLAEVMPGQRVFYTKAGPAAIFLNDEEIPPDTYYRVRQKGFLQSQVLAKNAYVRGWVSW